MRRQGFFFQRRWFAAVYITVAIFILLLISFVFYWFHARTMEDLKASQTEVLNNTSTVFQSQLDSFSLAAYQLYAMPASTVLLANPEDPVSFIIDFSKQGQSIMASNDLIDIVALFDEEEMVLTRQKRVISQESMNALHKKAVSVAQTLFYLEADRMAYGTPVRMLCTVVGDRSGSSWEQGVLLCVNADELADRLLSQLDYTYILDQDGNVLLSSQPELFGQQLPGYQQLLADFEKKGNPSAILTQLDGQESLVCVASCPESSFQVVSIQPVSQLQENLNRGLWQLFAATAFILSVAGVITLLLSKFLSRPADDLLKEIANLPPAPGTKAQAPMDPQLAHTMLLRTAHTIDQLQVVHRKDQQIQYLLGLTQDLSPQALFPTDSGWFLAVLQSDQPLGTGESASFPLIIETIGEILENSPQWQRNVILPVQDGTAALVCPGEGGGTEQLIPYLRRELAQASPCSISLSLSDREEPGSLLTRYQNTLGRMRAKSLRGDGALITRLGEEEAPQEKLPSQCVEDILNAVRAGEEERFLPLAQELLNQASGFHFEHTLHQLVDLCVSLFQTGGGRIPKNTLLWGEAYQKLWECFNRQQLEAQLAAFWAQAACHPTGSHKEEQIQAALDYINQHYADESLSMGAVAEHLRMSPSHFSRLFKEIMEESFPSYVNRLRLSSAYQWLLDERDSTIEKIAQESGFYSSSYFTTLFRKQYGLSPSQARRRPPEKGE